MPKVLVKSWQKFLRKIRPILRQEKAPYLLTILVAALGWTAVHLADRLQEGPTLELTTEIAGDGLAVTYTLRNLSRNLKFMGLNVHVVIPKDTARCVETKLEIPEPLWLGQRQPDGCDKSGEYAIFYLPTLHPGTEVVMTMKSDKPCKPQFRLNSGDQAYYVLSSSWQTKARRFETEILITLVLIWTALIAIYMWNLGGRRR